MENSPDNGNSTNLFNLTNVQPTPKRRLSKTENTLSDGNSTTVIVYGNRCSKTSLAVFSDAQRLTAIKTPQESFAT